MRRELPTEAVLETIRANQFKACYIRPIIYRGYNALGVNPFPCPVDTAILTWEWGAYLGQDALERGVDVRVASWSRVAPNTFPTLAKTAANYANSQLIKMEAVTEGYSEGIALDSFGYLSEGSGQNLFVVRDETVYTPPLTAAILPGITRSSVIGRRGIELPLQPSAPVSVAAVTKQRACRWCGLHAITLLLEAPLLSTAAAAGSDLSHPSCDNRKPHRSTLRQG